MSRVQSYLVIVIEYRDDMIRATNSFKEEDLRRDLDDEGIHWEAARKEVHLYYDVELPLDERLVRRLTHHLEMGRIGNFYVKDEISQ